MNKGSGMVRAVKALIFVAYIGAAAYIAAAVYLLWQAFICL